MEIVPYDSIDPVRLHDPEEAVVLTIGSPGRRNLNKFGELELDYADLVVRISTSGAVVEVTSRPAYVDIGGEHVPRHQLPEFLKARDPEARELHGFVVSRRHGIAVDTDTENDGWISVFAEGCWDELFSEA